MNERPLTHNYTVFKIKRKIYHSLTFLLVALVISSADLFN